MRCRNDYFENSFIPYVVREWNRLSTEIRNSTSCQEFRKFALIFYQTNLLFTVFYSWYSDTLNPLCSCSLEPEATSHYLLCCHIFSSPHLAHMNDLYLIGPSISRLNETALANILLYGDWTKSTSENSKILQSAINYIITIKHFDESLF